MWNPAGSASVDQSTPTNAGRDERGERRRGGWSEGEGYRDSQIWDLKADSNMSCWVSRTYKLTMFIAESSRNERKQHLA